MKNTMTKIAAGVAAVSFAAGASAWDVHEFSGSEQFQFHLVQNKAGANPNGDPAQNPFCGNSCRAFPPFLGQQLPMTFQAMIQIENEATPGGAGDDGAGCGTGIGGDVNNACFVPQNETYVAGADTVVLDASGNTGLGDAFTIKFVSAKNDEFIVNEPVYVVDAPTADYSITTDAEGKIIAGYWIEQLFVGGAFQTSYNSFDHRIAVTYSGGTAGDLDVAGFEADVANGEFDNPGVNDLLGLPNGTPGNGREFNSLADLAYLTCDLDDKYNCGGSAKAVPVPAFAAATLGLGLLGITFVTGRGRRTIK